MVESSNDARQDGNIIYKMMIGIMSEYISVEKRQYAEAQALFIWIQARNAYNKSIVEESEKCLTLHKEALNYGIQRLNRYKQLYQESLTLLGKETETQKLGQDLKSLTEASGGFIVGNS